MRFFWILAAFVLLPASAQAEWLEASSPHFVVYADDTERDIRRFSEQLERYHDAMAVITGTENPPPSPSNRLTVFVVRNQREVRRLFGEGGRYVGGFYIPRAGSSVAIVPKIDVSTGQLDQSMKILLHEYAHHFLISNSSYPTPRWLGEGSAEFFAAARFPADGGLALGLPAADRYTELAFADEVKVEELLDPDIYEKRRRSGYDSFYGKSWALFHYLTMESERRGQIRQYIERMSAGQSSRDAALETFGSFAALERDLRAYLRRPRLMTMVFQPQQLATGTIEVRRLRAGEAEIMPLRVRSRRGVTREQAIELVDEVRAVAARHPQDQLVLAALAEAEYDAGHDAAAVTAADAALAIDPAQVDAYVQKGFAMFRQAAEADDREAAFKAAAEPFLALNRREPDHPLALAFYFRSFGEGGRMPTENAVLALERALELAPFDLGLRMNVASQQILDGRLALARSNLLPVAYSPHANPMAEAARTVVERLDTEAPGEPEELLRLLSGPPAAEGTAEAAE